MLFSFITVIWHGIAAVVHMKPASARNLYLTYPIQFYIGAVFQTISFLSNSNSHVKINKNKAEAGNSIFYIQ
jgi:hypothetical protein